MKLLGNLGKHFSPVHAGLAFMLFLGCLAGLFLKALPVLLSFIVPTEYHLDLHPSPYAVQIDNIKLGSLHTATASAVTFSGSGLPPVLLTNISVYRPKIFGEGVEVRATLLGGIVYCSLKTHWLLTEVTGGSCSVQNIQIESDPTLHAVGAGGVFRAELLFSKQGSYSGTAHLTGGSFDPKKLLASSLDLPRISDADISVRFEGAQDVCQFSDSSLVNDEVKLRLQGSIDSLTQTPAVQASGSYSLSEPGFKKYGPWLQLLNNNTPISQAGTLSISGPLQRAKISFS